MIQNEKVDFVGLEPRTPSILREVLTGLSMSQKTLPPKLLYDKKGSEIFEQICRLEEYYPTRTEGQILKTYASEICSLIGPEALIIEPGSGAGEKIRHLLAHLTRPSGYVPIEISREILIRMTEELHEEFPDLDVIPVCADFTEDINLPLIKEHQRAKKVIFFPGSTIGNFHPHEAVSFLKNIGNLIGSGGGLVIGVDLKKDPDILTVAYDDPDGITAAFNLNLLERLNREIGAGFETNNFEHEAVYNEKLGRIEMHLVSRIPQFIKVHETIFRFQEGETIHTESSYKYSVDEFMELCAKARFRLVKHWKDEKQLFCVYYFEKE